MATNTTTLSDKYIDFAEKNYDLQDKITEIVREHPQGITLDELLVQLEDNEGIDKEILKSALDIRIRSWCTFFSKEAGRVIYSDKHQKYFHMKANHPKVRVQRPIINLY